MADFGWRPVPSRVAPCRWPLPALALAAAACATAPPPLAPSRAPGEGVKSVTVLRWDAGGRVDPVVALGESLRAKGLAVTALEVRRAPEPRRLERLRFLVQARVEGDRTDRAVGTSGLGPEAAEIVGALHVDAVALSVRLPAYATMPPPAGPGGLWPAPGLGPPPVDPIAPTPPAQAVAVVTAAGDAIWSGWGAQQEMFGAAGPEPLPAVTRSVNAVEAIEALVGALTGEPAETP